MFRLSIHTAVTLQDETRKKLYLWLLYKVFSVQKYSQLDTDFLSDKYKIFSYLTKDSPDFLDSYWRLPDRNNIKNIRNIS